uniref:Zinc finger protein CONSTANS-LIKE 13 n=1 Tax=Rhizophora mucronata TaxID=61149 RepID=A0A2P2LJJ8_RHIMU
MKAEEEQQRRRLCDYCDDAVALLYCRADSAKLCLACDREVHSTNQLFSKHTRSQLCDACDASPASIFCETEHSVFCQNCDWERHRLSLSPPHNRRPIEGFTDYPSVAELVTILGFEDLGEKKTLFLGEEGDGLSGPELDGSGFDDGYSDLFVWDSPAVISLDDLIVSSDSGHNFQALGVPPLPKNRNTACGQHREEILHQLRELARLESVPNYKNGDREAVNKFQSLSNGQDQQPRNMYACYKPDACPISFPAYEENVGNCFDGTPEAANNVYLPPALLRTNLEECLDIPDKQSDAGGSASHAKDGPEAPSQQPFGVTLPLFPKVAVHEINNQERDSALSRYKEKKKTRRYDKHIRYESRKARAEGRTRIKGRFAKEGR